MNILYGTPITSNVIRLTHANSNYKYGSRNPAVFLFPENIAHICTSLNENANHCFNSEVLTIGTYNTILIKQVFYKVDVYKYMIAINGTTVHSTLNYGAKMFENVKLYASDAFYSPALVNIKNLTFKNLPEGEFLRTTSTYINSMNDGNISYICGALL